MKRRWWVKSCALGEDGANRSKSCGWVYKHAPVDNRLAICTGPPGVTLNPTKLHNESERASTSLRPTTDRVKLIVHRRLSCRRSPGVLEERPLFCLESAQHRNRRTHFARVSREGSWSRVEASCGGGKHHHRRHASSSSYARRNSCFGPDVARATNAGERWVRSQVSGHERSLRGRGPHCIRERAWPDASRNSSKARDTFVQQGSTPSIQIACQMLLLSLIKLHFRHPSCSKR